MWKTIAGRCVYQSQSGVKVHQNIFYRWLTLNSNAIQTLISRRYPERHELTYIHQLTFAVRAQPANCCLLGLGGAAVAHVLSPYLKNMQLTAVENNTEIIDIAAAYFMTKHLKHLTVIQEDANLFVKHHDTRYQHLMIDLYDAHSFPTHCNTEDFFENCRRMLLPNGTLALNIANLDEQWAVFNNIRKTFCQRTVSLPVKGAANMVVLAYNGPSVAPLLDLLKNSHGLKELSWDVRWGCVAQI